MPSSADTEIPARPTALEQSINHGDSKEAGLLSIRGWLEGGAVGNLLDKPYVLQNNLSQSLILNQIYLVAEKKLERKKEFDWGFRIDNLIGEDWPIYHMQGFPIGSMGGNQFGWDPVQYYFEAYFPLPSGMGLEVQAGRFYTLTGFQREAPYRPLYTTGYLYDYTQFFTWLGVMTALEVAPGWKLYNGLVHTPDKWVNTGFEPNYAGGLGWATNDDKTSLDLAWFYGRDSVNKAPSPRLWVINAVIAHELAKDWSLVFEGNLGGESCCLKDSDYPHGNWWGLAGWTMYAISDVYKAVFRYEYFNDQAGSRTGTKGTYSSATFGVNVKPTKWLMLRPEVRYDWVDNSTPGLGNTHRLLLGADALIEF